MATDDEAMQFIERHRLYGKGIGYVDVHLLASVALTGGVTIWTRDRKLRQTAAAERVDHPCLMSAHPPLMGKSPKTGVGGAEEIV